MKETIGRGESVTVVNDETVTARAWDMGVWIRWDFCILTLEVTRTTGFVKCLSQVLSLSLNCAVFSLVISEMFDSIFSFAACDGVVAERASALLARVSFVLFVNGIRGMSFVARLVRWVAVLVIADADLSRIFWDWN